MRFKNNRGISLGVVIVVLLAAGMIIGSVLDLTLSSHRTQQDQYIWIDAKNAAEAAVEYGFAELVKRFDKSSAFPSDHLAPDNAPLELPNQYFTTFGATGGNWKMSKIILPDPSTYDPSESSQWDSWDTEIMGGVMPNGEWKFIDGKTPGNERDPLKNKLVFTRNINVYAKATATDFRGRKTTVYCTQELQVRDAPLFAHTIFYNMDMEIAPGPVMNVTDSVHSNGDAYVSANNALNFTGQLTAAGSIYHAVAGGINKSVSGGDVTFKDGSGNTISMRQSGSWLDSTASDWGEKSSQLWDGNVQSSVHGVGTLNPVAIEDYQRDDPSTGTLDDQLNYGYQLIQPVLETDDSHYNKSIEEQKFAYKAGLTIEVDTGSWGYTLKTYQRDSDGNLIYDATTGEPVTTTLNLNTADPDNRFMDVADYGYWSYSVQRGMYDKRRGKGIGLATVDVGKLKALIEANDANDWGGDVLARPEKWWNGVVYVAFDTGSTTGDDGVNPARYNDWGVQLTNGGSIPNPSFAQSDGIYGTTIATNNPIYIHGNYNADGNFSTGADGNADSASEPPAAVIGDAVTILSNNWQNYDSDESLSSRYASNTEVSAAIMSGLVPSDNSNNNTYSGGVENFPRFLENWSGRTFRYRGSIVSLYESEVATEPWGGGDIYGAPNRDWSFDKKFGTGKYPPGTPNTRTYRRINFRELNKSEWESEIAQLKTDLGIS